MKKIFCVTAFLVIVVVFFKPANALDLRIQPRFKTGIQFYEFEQEAFQFPARDSQGKYPNEQSRLAYSDWLPFVSGGATLFVNRFFVDFDVQYLFDGEAESDFISQTFITGSGEEDFLLIFCFEIIVNLMRILIDLNGLFQPVLKLLIIW